MSNAEDRLFALVRGLWRRAADDPFAALLPQDLASLTDFYPRLRRFVDEAPRRLQGRVDPTAIVQGELISTGEGSVIEAGVVVHESCRLILGAGSRVRSGCVLRDEVVVGPECLIGAECEVYRSLILGPGSVLAHDSQLGDSILGREVIVAGATAFANATLHKGQTVRLRFAGERIDSGRSHLGALVGDGVRIGGASFLCPGCVVLPNLALPPRVVLLGTIDASRREALLRKFFRDWEVAD